MKSNFLFLVFGILLTATLASADLPKNNLHLFDNVNKRSNVTEEQFNKITDAIIDAWKPIAAKHGAELVVEKKWNDSTVNAFANQSGKTWKVAMFGGLARRPEVTPDGYALVVCHELGHHFAGHYFYGDRDWAASEGQADYFATQVCAKKMFAQYFDRRFLGRTDVPPYVKERCDAIWNTPAAQSLCYRSAAAGHSLASLLAAIGGGAGAPKFDTPDTSKVTKTNTRHPAAQCRLDTYFAGALCPAPFDLLTIPAKGLPAGQNSIEGEKIAAQSSCFETSTMKLGYRPYCWFKPQTSSFLRN